MEGIICPDLLVEIGLIDLPPPPPTPPQLQQPWLQLRKLQVHPCLVLMTHINSLAAREVELLFVFQKQDLREDGVY